MTILSYFQYVQLERDLQTVLDEKEEQETERDAYKHKYERLNKELNYILKGDEKRILDIDGLSTENRYENNEMMTLNGRFRPLHRIDISLNGHFCLPVTIDPRVIC
jgi:hypothetical protein